MILHYIIVLSAIGVLAGCEGAKEPTPPQVPEPADPEYVSRGSLRDMLYSKELSKDIQGVREFAFQVGDQLCEKCRANGKCSSCTVKGVAILVLGSGVYHSSLDVETDNKRQTTTTIVRRYIDTQRKPYWKASAVADEADLLKTLRLFGETFGKTSRRDEE